MEDPVLETLLKRDRAIVVAALVALTALSWAYVLWLAANMSTAMPAMPPMPDMPGMVMGPEIKPWTLDQLALSFAMWTVMMIGMMMPSAAPMILLYAHVGRRALQDGKPFVPAFWFAGGYLLAWTAFAAMASLAQGALLDAALITPMLASANTLFGGIVLIAAGLYQWTPIKDSCLTQCQSPIGFLQRHGGFKRTELGSLRLGFEHGLHCVGCCAPVMALLFVGGVMNLLRIAGLSILVLAEKALPPARAIARGLGLVLVAAGLILLYKTVR
jgi:predicted metal-binding membrane protein